MFPAPLPVQFGEPIRFSGSKSDTSARAQAQGARPRSPVEITAAVLQGRWSAQVLWSLFWGNKSFYRILREVEGVTRSALTREIETLERAELVAKRVLGPGAPRVEYSLTPAGASLKPVLAVMYEWGLLARELPPLQELVVQKHSGPRGVQREVSSEPLRSVSAPAGPVPASTQPEGDPSGG